MIFRETLASLFLGIFSLACYSQDSLHTPIKKVKVLPLPAFGYSPETSTYIGAVALLTLDLYEDTITRTSNTKFEVNYTWNNQLILETEWNYFFREENWFTKGKIHFSDYPDVFYGIGPYSSVNDKIGFESVRLQFIGEVWKRIGQNYTWALVLDLLNFKLKNLKFLLWYPTIFSVD